MLITITAHFRTNHYYVVLGQTYGGVWETRIILAQMVNAQKKHKKHKVYVTIQMLKSIPAMETIRHASREAAYADYCARMMATARTGGALNPSDINLIPPWGATYYNQMGSLP